MSPRCCAGCRVAVLVLPTRSRTFRWCASPSIRNMCRRRIRCAPATRSRFSLRCREAEPMIGVKEGVFAAATESGPPTAGNHCIGGIACFVGVVRDLAGDARIASMTLEHYPGMTERKLAEIEAEARQRWPLE